MRLLLPTPLHRAREAATAVLVPLAVRGVLMSHIAFAGGIRLIAELARAGAPSAYPTANQTGHGDYSLLFRELRFRGK